ncbi:right-handed parallel beta-helix repeat-containing protein [Pseudactinotalea terrae]|uniref:right-handed parallel beta-helix repeat-containing protein n=1 Tax=Pseudactinotalea terrae TaxID=1743262 RepID=UPI0012E1F553|nr:right-handed parallel beta-helix repeat-containing protein [Pseudactinotalea terrae]
MELTRRALLSAGVGLTTAGALARPDLSTAAHAAAGTATTWQSDMLKVSRGGRLVYPRRGGLRLPDWAQVGYRNGQSPPEVPTVQTIGPVAGDNTSHLQTAIDAVGALPPGDNGFRGAILLQAGEYPVAGTVYLRHSGVVLRGVGDDADPATNTVIRAVGNTPNQRDVVVVGGGSGLWNGDARDWSEEVAGTRTDITSDVVPLAGNTFTVADPEALAVGDNVIIVHPCTQAWLDAIDGGGTADAPPWAVGSQPIAYNRYVTAIEGDRVTIDAPVFYQLDRALSQSFVYVWDRAGLVTDVGVESLRVDIEFNGEDDDEDHAWNAIRLVEAENAWVRDCTMLHFGLSGVAMFKATRVTVSGCRALDPKSRITGSRRYSFSAERSVNLALVTDCYANHARHAYVSNGTTTASGIVFHRCVAEGSLTSSEGHRRWTHGLLYDNHLEIEPVTGRALALYNRGSWGTQHGWSAAHCVAWKADVADSSLSVQQPPTAQNYAIGCFGTVNGDGVSASDDDAGPGYIEGTDRPGLEPDSLYEAQFAARPS